jgi:hypothetical protein
LRRALLLPLALAACADRPGDRDPLAGRVAGEPVDCITLSQQTAPQVVDANTILYRGSARRIYRTGPVGACPGLNAQGPHTLIIDVYGGQICRNDRFRVLTPGQTIPSAFCRFDRFTPYDRPPGG